MVFIHFNLKYFSLRAIHPIQTFHFIAKSSTNTDPDSESAPLVKKSKSSTSAENTNKPSKTSSTSKPGVQQHVISSLFNKNPEIPDVKL